MALTWTVYLIFRGSLQTQDKIKHNVLIFNHHFRLCSWTKMHLFAKLDEFGILDVIVVDDYWNRKVLHGLEIEQRPRVCG